ncbi:MAG: hypothetical protein AAF416_11430 [Pseudomonadota bacterium]
MILLEIVLALLALAGFGSFLYVIVSFVPQVELIAIIGIVVGMAVFDFMRDLSKTIRSYRK